jgi:hypothetical protein
VKSEVAIQSRPLVTGGHMATGSKNSKIGRLEVESERDSVLQGREV